MEHVKLTRRDFLKVSAAAGGGLVIGFHLGGCEDKAPPQPQAVTAEAPVVPQPVTQAHDINAWLTIHTDGAVTIRVGSSEMGQGTLTGIAMIIADELDADWSRVQAEHAPAHESFYNPIMGQQRTGGSTAIRGFYTTVRKAGAAGRELMVQAAARQWGVDVNQCKARNGVVHHENSGRSLDYGQLAEAAAQLPVPEFVFLKETEEFTLIGKTRLRLDTPIKVNGEAVFGMDVQLPDMLTAVISRTPVLGGTVKSFNATRAMAVPGVKRVERVSHGVAVIADHFWAAKKGRDALHIEWDTAGNDKLDSAAIEAQFKTAIANARVERDDGNIDKAITGAAKTLETAYIAPYQAHACMEPMNATADVRADACVVYAPTQAQTASQDTAMRITGLAQEKVELHTTFLGGGFGRRSEQDFITDAVECSKLAGRPVKVIWTREDDIMHDQFRPFTYNEFRGAVDAKGRIIAWEHRIAGSSIRARTSSGGVVDGRDSTSTMGASDLPYQIPNIRVSYAMANTPVPVGFWRSVGSSQNAYITECFLDELAKLGGRDPLELRLELLADHPRHAGVLQLAADKAGWGSALPPGRARGIAMAESFTGYVAQVAEVSIDKGAVRVHRVTCAIDCGTVVNPGQVAAQMESAIVYGLTACLKGEITIANGQVRQRNFDDYPLLRLDECPEIDVHIVASEEVPAGVGEPGVPPTAPAVANAVFALTGQPVRRLPIRIRT